MIHSLSAPRAAGAVSFCSRSGRAITIRSARADDAPAISAMIGGLSPRTIALRYHLPLVRLSPEAARREAERVTSADRGRIVYLALAAQGERPEIIGIAELACDRAEPDLAESAIVVADSFQSDGIGRAIVGQLVAAADRRGIARVRALTQTHNAAVRRLVVGLGRPYSTRFTGGEVMYEIR